MYTTYTNELSCSASSFCNNITQLWWVEAYEIVAKCTLISQPPTFQLLMAGVTKTWSVFCLMYLYCNVMFKHMYQYCDKLFTNIVLLWNHFCLGLYCRLLIIGIMAFPCSEKTQKKKCEWGWCTCIIRVKRIMHFHKRNKCNVVPLGTILVSTNLCPFLQIGGL